MQRFRALALVVMGVASMWFESKTAQADSPECEAYCSWCYGELELQCPDSDWRCSCTFKECWGKNPACNIS